MKYKLTAASVIVIAVFGVGGGWLASRKPSVNQPATSNSVATTGSPKLTASRDGKVIAYEGQTGHTALELLQSLATVQTTQSSFGEFVTTINGITADGSKQFWSFYVNGSMANEGASTYQAKTGDKIEWRVEEVR